MTFEQSPDDEKESDIQRFGGREFQAEGRESVRG